MRQYTLRDLALLDDLIHKVALVQQHPPVNQPELLLSQAATNFIAETVSFMEFVKQEMERQEPPRKRRRSNSVA